MRQGRGFVYGTLVMALVMLCFATHPAFAASTVDQLQQSISEKKAEIDSLNAKLDQYKLRIQELSGQSASLENDVALLENEITMAELDIAATQNSIDQETLELRILDHEMENISSELVAQRAALSDVLFTMNTVDQRTIFDVVLHVGSVHDVFEAAQQLAHVNEDVKSALESTKLTKRDLEERQVKHEEAITSLQTIASDLTRKTANLETRKRAKEVLAAATQDSENEYRALLSEVRSEQQSIANEITSLQSEVQNKLAQNSGALSDDGQGMSWPVHGVITTLFHDPTYPFRHLFEHSGLDIAVPQGTAIEAAAPGYVARVYQGDMYGYYVMIIHADGLATLYAHMSRIDVQQDQYVARGQVIGLSGGRPGTPGAGFSTGPHVHFEVRSNGIPTNPLAYLDRSLL